MSSVSTRVRRWVERVEGNGRLWRVVAVSVAVKHLRRPADLLTCAMATSPLPGAGVTGNRSTPLVVVGARGNRGRMLVGSLMFGRWAEVGELDRVMLVRGGGAMAGEGRGSINGNGVV